MGMENALGRTGMEEHDGWELLQPKRKSCDEFEI